MAGMPHLVQVQEKYKAQGLIVFASHCQQVEQGKVVALCRSKKVNYTVVDGARLAGDDTNGIPHAWLFDASGKVVMEGHVEQFNAKIEELLAKEPHWITRGKKLESKEAKGITDGLKAQKPFGWALEQCEAILKKGGESKAHEEATFLKEQLTAEGDRRLAEAKAMEEENAFRAEGIYKEIELVFKKGEAGTKAAERAKELKKDKAFQDEVKVGKMVAQVEELCASMKAVNGTYNPDNPANRDAAAQVTAIAKQLKSKQYAESKTAKKCLDGLKDYGL
ncbi:MAG: hypothetical protein ACAI25_13615 [Planctomycetota bacterium]